MVNGAEGGADGQPRAAFHAFPVLVGQNGARGVQVRRLTAARPVHRVEGGIDHDARPVDGVAGRGEGVEVMPLVPVLRLVDGKVQERFADAAAVSAEAAPEKAPGGQEHRLGVDHRRSGFGREAQPPAAARGFHPCHVPLVELVHADGRQALLEGLAEPDARHGRRHGGHLEHGDAQTRRQILEDLPPPQQPDDGRKAHRAGVAHHPLEALAEGGAPGGIFQQGTEMGRVHLSPGAGEAQADRPQPRPFGPQAVDDLRGTEALQAIDGRDAAGRPGLQGLDPRPHAQRNPEGPLPCPGKGKDLDIALPAAVGQPLGGQKGENLVERLGYRPRGQPAQGMLGPIRGQGGQGFPGVLPLDPAIHRVDPQQVHQAAGELQFAGAPDLNGGNTPVRGKQRRGHAAETRADHGQFAVDFGRWRHQGGGPFRGGAPASRPRNPQSSASWSSACTRGISQSNAWRPFQRSRAKARISAAPAPPL